MKPKRKLLHSVLIRLFSFLAGFLSRQKSYAMKRQPFSIFYEKFRLKLAEDQPKLAACVVNYGSLPSDPAILEKIHAPVQGNFGADDQGIPATDVRAFEAAMKAVGKPTDIKIYDGAGHAFQNPNNKQGYRAEAAADAAQRISAFSQKYLR